MKKYFVVTDVHGFYGRLRSVLDENGFDMNNSNHILISCGDLFDRGGHSWECLEFIMGLPEERRILIRGNHEDLLEDCLYRRKMSMVDVHNGTADTIDEFADHIDDQIISNVDKCIAIKDNKVVRNYFYSLQNYAIVGKYLFVHGWVPTGCSIKELDTCDIQRWQEARWLNGMEEWNCIKSKWFDGITVVCGHWHTSWGHKNLHHNGSEFGPTANFTPFIDNGIIALDGCTAYSHKMNCFVFEEEA